MSMTLPSPATTAGATKPGGALAHLCATHANRTFETDAHPCEGQTGCRSFCGIDIDALELAFDAPSPDDCVVCVELFHAWYDRRFHGGR